MKIIADAKVGARARYGGECQLDWYCKKEGVRGKIYLGMIAILTKPQARKLVKELTAAIEYQQAKEK